MYTGWVCTTYKRGLGRHIYRGVYPPRVPRRHIWEIYPSQDPLWEAYMGRIPLSGPLWEARIGGIPLSGPLREAIIGRYTPLRTLREARIGDIYPPGCLPG